MAEEPADPPSKRWVKPPPQENVRAAVEKAVQALAGQSAQQYIWLGAALRDGRWLLRVLDDTLAIDPADGSVATAAGLPVVPAWQVLVLHYLGVAARPAPRPPQVTFADLASGRGYAGVYQNRVIRRLCATAGRDAATLAAAAERLGAGRIPGGDAAFAFTVFPRLTLHLVWHAPDEEFPPTATVLLPENVEELFCTEDIVVLCESLVARLSGRTFH